MGTLCELFPQFRFRFVSPRPYPHPKSQEHTLSDVKEAYRDLVDTLRDLGAALIPARAAQFEAPPRGSRGKESVSESRGVRNPTLDIVMDPRRSALSDRISDADTALRLARQTLAPHATALQQAVARWEGQEGTP